MATKVYSFHFTLSYSRAQFCCYTTSCDMVTFWDCHRRAFAHFGGVPVSIVVEYVPRNMLGAHELRDVLAVTAFRATEHRAQRKPERQAGREGRGEVDRQNLQQWQHGHDPVRRVTTRSAGEAQSPFERRRHDP